ncbi:MULTISPECIES: hypothetical protein [unclassified Streptomyces]|uniref:hypothetical protein n=1 Tax=unclassified Streptomyces TaxID=2593676 RepID=UPI002E253CAF
MGEVEITDRLQRRVRRDFPDAEVAKGVEGALRSTSRKLDPDGRVGAGGERLMAALVIYARGDIGRLKDAVKLAHLDWRDLFVATDLADEDFEQRLDDELPGPT